MNLYVILLKTEPDYQLLKRLISDHPQLKKGFKCREILKLSSLSFNDKKALKEMFGGQYPSIHTPTINFECRNGKWEVEEIDFRRGFHQRITQVLNNALNEGKYPLGSPVSTKDSELFEFLTKENNCWFQREFSLSEAEDYGIPITQESLEFISNKLQERLGETSCFNYGFVRAFLEVLGDYDEEILIPRFLEEK
jgi:hypothetical protein